MEPAGQGTSAAGRTTSRAGRPPGALALAFALAAALGSWNPLAAPFAFVVAVSAAVMGGRALRRGGRRLARAALGLGVAAAIASVVVLGLTAGAVGAGPSGDPVVRGRTPAELEKVLDEAAHRTREERERAHRELERLAAPDAGPVRPGGP